MIIGITGNSGSGKTSISKLLKEELNADIINADEVVKEMSMPGMVYYKEIIKAFGEDILLQSCKIDKLKLADIIFKDNKKRDVLNSLTFKYIVDEIKARADSSKSEIIIIDAPLLIESKLNEICDIVISVIADEDIKIKRICSRDNIDKQTASNRIKAQPKNEFYIKNSNVLIINNNNSNLEKQVAKIKQLIYKENKREII
jgi:dephospho-CoA kinase